MRTAEREEVIESVRVDKNIDREIEIIAEKVRKSKSDLIREGILLMIASYSFLECNKNATQTK